MRHFGNTETSTQEDIDNEFDVFWKPILYKDGKLDIEQLKKELFDYSRLLNSVGIVYCEVTGNKISKPNTDPYCVLREYENYVSELIDEQIKENESD